VDASDSFFRVATVQEPSGQCSRRFAGKSGQRGDHLCSEYSARLAGQPTSLVGVAFGELRCCLWDQAQLTRLFLPVCWNKISVATGFWIPALPVSGLNVSYENGGQGIDSLAVIFAGDSHGMVQLTCQLQIGTAVSSRFSVYVQP
jgi:hypothetical protein